MDTHTTHPHTTQNSAASSGVFAARDNCIGSKATQAEFVPRDRLHPRLLCIYIRMYVIRMCTYVIYIVG
jgi:hypothetical protein